jgi:hypothetical protein
MRRRELAADAYNQQRMKLLLRLPREAMPAAMDRSPTTWRSETIRSEFVVAKKTIRVKE